MAIQNPIKFLGRSPQGGDSASDGYEAIILQEICEALLDARDQGLAVTEQDKRYVKYADALIRSFAKIGIIARVDEATGYQEVRNKEALKALLDAFLRPPRAGGIRGSADDLPEIRAQPGRETVLGPLPDWKAQRGATLGRSIISIGNRNQHAFRLDIYGDSASDRDYEIGEDRFNALKTLVETVLSSIDAAALPANPSLQIPYLNRVLERFYSQKPANTTVRWRGTNTSASFAIAFDKYGDAFLTLPRCLLSILAAGYGASGVLPSPQYKFRFSAVPIQGPWYGFSNAAYGVGDDAIGWNLQDAGDGFTTFADILEPSYLRIVTEQAEAMGATMLFRGKDANGNEIWTGTGVQTIQGVQLDISAGLTTQTAQAFSEAPSLVAKPVTYGPVSMFAVSVATGVATLIGTYDPGETSPGYRRYKLGSTNTNTLANTPYVTIHAMTKRRFVPVVVAKDEVIPGNISAIEQGFIARRYDLQSDTKTADAYWEDAIALLNAELNEFNGGALPRVIFEKDSGLARIPFIN